MTYAVESLEQLPAQKWSNSPAVKTISAAKIGFSFYDGLKLAMGNRSFADVVEGVYKGVGDLIGVNDETGVD